MAAPITLRAWRRHVWSPDRTPPPRRTLRQLTALTPSGRDTYDKARIAWHGTDVLLTTRDIRALETMARVATLVNAGHTAAARRGIAVSAPATLGKTTALLHLGRQHEMRTCHGEPSTERAPVAYIATPAGATPKMIMTTFARFYGVHYTQHTTLQVLTDRVADSMVDVQTTMVLLDEVHNLRTHRASGAEAASTVKMLSDRLDATFVYAGIDLTRTDLFAGDIGSQIRSRMILHEIHPYPLATRRDHTAWSELVAGCENQLILARHPTGSLLAHADYLHARTHGRLGALRGLLCDTAARAILNGTEKITKRLLDTVPTDLQVHTEPAPAPATRTRPRMRQTRA